jgi:Xaa-Pro aminopeptidase
MTNLSYHEKLQKLRTILQQDALDGMILTTHDPFFSEYPPDHFKRLAWLTGFTGSAGSVIVMQDQAIFFTDGRYTLQASMELDEQDYTIHDSQHITPLQWLQENAAAKRIAFDSWSVSFHQFQQWQKPVPGPQWVGLKENPIDQIWQDRPAFSQAAAFEHLYEYAGKMREQKIRRIAQEIRKAEAESLLLCLPESVCWLLNIRGRDMDYTPLLLSRALVHRDNTVELYVDEQKIGPELRHGWQGLVRLHDPAQLPMRCQQMAEAQMKVACDTASTPVALARALGDSLQPLADPCIPLKAKKNATELHNIAQSHKIDGLALTRFLQWLQQISAQTEINEWEASQKLDALRAEHPDFLEPSFPTISGYGPNGAIIHYRVTQETALPLKQGSLYLVDSGGQYPSGTTDVTRTVAIGEPTAAMKHDYTQVLKGHIALANAIFPAGTSGKQLDSLARQFLWRTGRDYAHGTGHGVGCFLGVHEGPQSISKRGADVALEAGMILSNEPGYYLEGHYGIRIENLMVVCSFATEDKSLGFSLFDSDGYPSLSQQPLPQKEGHLYFRTLTCAPLDENLIEYALLTQEEKDWVQHYHQWVEKTL